MTTHQYGVRTRASGVKKVSRLDPAGMRGESVVGEGPGRDGDAQCIHHGQHIDDFLCDGACNRRQKKSQQSPRRTGGRQQGPANVLFFTGERRRTLSQRRLNCNATWLGWWGETLSSPACRHRRREPSEHHWSLGKENARSARLATLETGLDRVSPHQPAVCPALRTPCSALIWPPSRARASPPALGPVRCGPAAPGSPASTLRRLPRPRCICRNE